MLKITRLFITLASKVDSNQVISTNYNINKSNILKQKSTKLKIQNSKI